MVESNGKTLGFITAACILLIIPSAAYEGHDLVDCSSTAGDFTIELDHQLSPIGVARFIDLVLVR